MSSIRAQKALWEGHGGTDPLWAILTDPRRKGGRWKPADFFRTGRAEVDALLRFLRGLGLRPRLGGVALDFGCGAGRLTQALALRFRRAEGVDIAQSMVEAARRYSRLGGRCRFHVNASEGLPLFEEGSFDFIYASIVLQHIPPASARVYLKDFLRVLKPGGLLAFNLPFADRTPWSRRWRYRLRLRTRAKRLLQALGLARFENFDPHPIPMHAHREEAVRDWLQKAGGQVLHVQATNTTNDSFYTDGLKFYEQAPEEDAYPSLMYVVKKI